MIDASQVFAEGRLLGLPTETVYGLAAPIDRPDLITRIFDLKGRPLSNPLIVHVGTLAQARQCVRHWPDMASLLAAHFWPGPLTMVLPRSERISDLISAGQDTVGLRMPDHPLALAVLRASPVPLVAPSANLSTRVSPTRAEDVSAAFSVEDVTVLDGGRCRVGIESTIVAVDDEQRKLIVLRPGQITSDALKAILPDDWQLIEVSGETEPSDQRPVAPGQMRKHYRPQKLLTVRVIDEDARVLARQELANQTRVALIELANDPDRAAHELYQSLRNADSASVDSLVLLLPAKHLSDPAWSGIIDRLTRAASYWKNT